MSLPKKLAVFALLAAIPYATAQGAEPDIEINFEPNSNLEVVIQHTKGFLDTDYDFDPRLERDVTLTRDDHQILNTNEDGYSYAIEEKEAEEFHCDCQDDQNHATNDDDYEADYDQVVVESEADNVDEKIEYDGIFIDNEEESPNDENEDQLNDEDKEIEECNCQDDQDHADNDNDDYEADYDQVVVESEADKVDEKIEYDGIFIDNEEEHPNDEEKEMEECNCQDDQGHADNDTDDYEADYDQVVVESEADEVKDDNNMDNFLSPDMNGDEDQGCDCEDDKSDADDEDYDADLDEIFIESEVEVEKDNNADEIEEEERRQKNLRAAALAAEKDEDVIENQEDIKVVVTYDQIMASMSQEEREIEEKTGEPFYKRMYDLVLGKETQKELEAANILNHDSDVLERKPKFYYDGL